MSKERLSKLQKWILLKANENGKGVIARWQIHEFFGEPNNKTEVSISRSIKRLIERKYLVGYSMISKSSFPILAGMMRLSLEETKERLDAFKDRRSVPVPAVEGTKNKLLFLTDEGSNVASILKFEGYDTPKLKGGQ